MENETKARTQTVKELEKLRRRVAQLEKKKTLHEKAEKGRKKRIEKYLSLFDSMTAIVWCIDREGKIIRANKTTVDGSGLTAKDIIGKTLHDLFPPD